MTNSRVSQRRQRSEQRWLPSLLLLAQLLTITPVLLIVFADEHQRRASDGYVTLLDGLDRLSFAIAELENIPRTGLTRDRAAAAGAAWQQQYSGFRGELDGILSSPATTPQIRETLARVDSIVQRMANAESSLAGLNQSPEQAEPLAAGLKRDGRTARSELLNAQRLVRFELAATGNGITQKTTYLKALVAGACLLAFGVVLVVRRFRVDAAVQRQLQQELRTTNEEVIAALAAARSESEAKNRFLAHIGHLMRTPLNAIVGGTGELLRTELTGRSRECAQTSRELAESLATVAGQVVDFSQMESGRFELQAVEFEPATIVADVLQFFAPPAERKGLRLKSAIGKGLPSLVKGDPERLRQALANLMSNAVRFTQQGEIWLRVEAAIGAEGRTSLRFEVRDTGIGITEQARSRIFQPFGVLQPTKGPITAGNQGAGLGLAISKKLVELMGGKIDVASEPGRGCTFSFTAVFESVHSSSEPRPESRQTAAFATDAIGAAGVGSRGTRKPRTEGKQGRERRTEARQSINYPTMLRSEDAGIAVIRVLDVSASGLRVSVPFRLEPQTEVEIRIEGASVVGIVRNCSCVGAREFHVGIEIPQAASADEHALHHLRLLRTVRVLHRG